MDLLQLLNKDDLEQLATTFGDGLSQSEFVDVMKNVVYTKANESPLEYAGALKKWKSKALRDLFQAIDYNQDGTLQYEELTNFAINSALHHTKNQVHRLELQFRDYHLLLPPQPSSYGGTTVTNAGNFTPMSDQILKGRGHFQDQSAQLKKLFYLRGAKKFVAEGFTRTTLHDAANPDPLSRLDVSGNIIDVATAHNNTYLVLSTDRNLIEVFEQASMMSQKYVKRKSLYTDRAVTQFLKADSGLGVLPQWFGGTGDREGLIRYCNMERLHAQLSLLGNNLDSLTILRRKIHTDEVTSLHFMNPRFGGESIISSAQDNRIVIHDVESGAVRFEPMHSHKSYVRRLALSNIHNVGFSIGQENFACMFNLDHVQHSVVRLEDYKDPHAHKLVGIHCVTNTHQVITADAGGLLKLWDIRQLQPIRSFHVPPLEVDAVSTNQKLKHQRSSYGEPDAKPLPQSSARTEIQVSQKCNLINTMVYCDETKKVYTIGKETTVFQYDTSTLVPKAHADPLVAILYNAVEEQLITASASELKLWNMRNGCCTSSFSDLFTAPDGSPILSASIRCMTLDHVGGKRMFLGSSNGMVSCVIPATGKSEWCMMVRGGAPIQHIVFATKNLFVGFVDGFIASTDVNDPHVTPRVVFEPGTSMVVAPINNAISSSHTLQDDLSPTSMHRRITRRRSKIRRQSIVPQSTSQVNQSAPADTGAESQTVVAAPSKFKVASSSGSSVSQYCVSHVMRMFLVYCTFDQSLLALEFGAKSCICVTNTLSCPITAMCFVKESPWDPPPTKPKTKAPKAVPSNSRATIRPSPDSCALSLFAVGLASGAVQFYSVHMAEVASRLTTTLLAVVDVLDGVSINALQCVQRQYLVAGCDADELVVWDVESLVRATDAFSQRKANASRQSSVTLGDVAFGALQTSCRAEGDGNSTLLQSASLVLDESIDEWSWEARMEAVNDAVQALHASFPMGKIELEDQTFVSHCVKIAESGVVACASGELDSIVRIVTIDGMEVGLLALGRTEEDAQDAQNSHKRNQQPLRSHIEGQMLKKHRAESPPPEQDGLLMGVANISPSAAPWHRSPSSSESSPHHRGVRSPKRGSGLRSPQRSSSRDGPVASPRRPTSQQHHDGAMLNRHSPALVPPRDDLGGTITQPPGSSSNGAGGKTSAPYAPYLWDNIFGAREWRPNADFIAPRWDEDTDRTALRRRFVPPALAPVAAVGSVDQEARIPELVIDFLRIQAHHNDEEEEGWAHLLEGGLYDEQHLKKEIRKVEKRIRVIEKRRSQQVEQHENNCPESVRRLVRMENDEELQKLRSILTALRSELDAMHSLVVFESPKGATESEEAAYQLNTSAFGPDPLEAGVVQKDCDALLSQSTLGGVSGHGSPNYSSGTLELAGSSTFASQRTAWQPNPPPRSLESLAKRRLTMRSRELAAQMSAPHHQRPSVAQPQQPVSHPLPAAAFHRTQLREHHTELDRLPHRLARGVKRHKPVLRQLHRSDKRVSPEVTLDGLDEEYVGDSEMEELNNNAGCSSVDALVAQATEPTEPLFEKELPPLPAEAGVRIVSPQHFRSNAEAVHALLRGVRIRKDDALLHQSANAQIAPLHGPTRGAVHQSGELSTRGVLIKQEADALNVRQKFKEQRARERMLLRKAHIAPQALDEMTDLAAELTNHVEKRDPAAMERVRTLVFPPIVPATQPLQRHNGTARTMQPIPSDVAGMLRVKTVSRTQSPTSVRQSRQEPKTAR